MHALLELIGFLIDNGPGRNDAERAHLHDLLAEFERAVTPAPTQEGNQANA